MTTLIILLGTALCGVALWAILRGAPREEPGPTLQIEASPDDLSRVESVLWGQFASTAEAWPEDMPWADFAEAMQQGPEIIFTRPVRVKSVHPGSVFLTAVLWERQGDYLLSRRIPAKPEPIEAEGDLARRFRVSINPDWFRNEIGSRSELKTGGRIELTIRGQMVRDRCDNFLDAVPLSYAPTSPPRSRPGDDFIALLRFAAETRASPAQTEPEAAPHDEAS